MIIPYKSFTGIFPRVEPTLLPSGAAQDAVDCDFSKGTLTGIQDWKQLGNAPGARSLFVYDKTGAVVYWTGTEADAHRSPIADDAYGRMYWTDETGMKVQGGSAGWSNANPAGKKVGVPRPTTAPTLASDARDFDKFLVASGATGGGFGAFTELPDGSLNAFNAVMTWLGPNYESQTVLDTVLKKQWVLPLNGFSLEGVEQTTETSTTTSGYVTAVHPLLNTPVDIWIDPTDPTRRFLVTRVTDEDGVSTEVLTAIGADEYPSAGLTASTTATVVTPTMAILFVVDMADGTRLWPIIRGDYSQSSLPPEMEGVSAYWTIDSADPTNVIITLTRDAASIEHRAYCYTYVNAFGEEGAPSDTIEFDCFDGETIPFNYAADASSDYVAIDSIRLYRTATGSTETNFLFTLESKLATGTRVVDSKRKTELGEPLMTINYSPAPDGVSGLTLMPNGIFAMFKGNEIYFTEPYLPYACRVDYPITTSHDVVGLCAAEGGIFVTTKANPYFISGTTPDAMGQTKITSVQAGLNKGSMVNIGKAVAYACNDGIALAAGLQVDMGTSLRFFTREKWRELYGSKLSMMRLSMHDGNLLVWFTDRSPGLLIRLDSEPMSMTEITHGITAAFVHPVGDALYLCDGAYYYEFKGLATRRPFYWWGNDTVVPKPTNFGAVQLIGTGGAVTLKLYADGALKHTVTSALSDTGRTILRLPSGYLARRWSMDVAGVAGTQITELYLSNAVTELQSV